MGWFDGGFFNYIYMYKQNLGINYLKIIILLMIVITVVKAIFLY